MGIDDRKFLSQFVPWDKEHISVSQEENCHG